MARVRLETSEIVDWPSFHRVSRETFGFPDFYGANEAAWIDCMTYLRHGDGMSRFHLAPTERLHIEVVNAKKFRKRAPRMAEALERLCFFVNERQTAQESGWPVLVPEPVLVLEYL